MAYFEGDLHTVMAAHRADRAVGELNALERRMAADEARMRARTDGSRRAARADEARAVAARSEREQLLTRTSQARNGMARASDLERRLRADLARAEARDARIRKETLAIDNRIGAALREGDAAKVRADRHEACAAGARAVCVASVRALDAAAPGHALLAPTGRSYPNGTQETPLSVVRDDAYDLKADELGLGSVIRAS